MPAKPVPIGELFNHVVCNAIDKHSAQQGNHAIRAKDARERAVIFLRLLAGEREWSDGYERKVDDCMEMNDGDAVCGWLLEFADSDPCIKALMANHSLLAFSTPGGVFTVWEKYRNAHRAGELALT